MTTVAAPAEAAGKPDGSDGGQPVDMKPAESGQADLAEAAKIRYLQPEDTSFAKTVGNMLSIKIDGTEHPVVYVHCSFPHTNKRIYLSIRTFDNKELGMIRSLDDFPGETAELLEEQINIRYFCPEIIKVIKIKEEFGYSYWDTETTAGICRFTVRSGGGNAKLVGHNRLLVLDVDGNRFVIPDLERLTDKEYRMVEMCM
ncbi:DUF1854 domain-containing protein [Paenibacillus hodogayensis]|uniref:DUF1854 domain-containing protein n=1 Tax=Paenibacillus hodogayensis TaxID=279208 RepID=A0ABV5VY17_9BACL